MKEFDTIIIGFGKGGKTLAAALAEAGQRVAMIEKSEKMYGGTCINVACIPSKVLADRAKLAARMFGAVGSERAALSASEGDFAARSRFYAESVRKKNGLIDTLRTKNFDKLNAFKNVTILTGTAEFTGPHTVHVSYGNGSEEIHGTHIVIDTGSRPVIPAVPGIGDSHRVYTSETLMENETLPARLVIIGGGYIGVEFASMYANFGSHVTIVHDSPAFLSREDEDIAGEVRARLEEQGIEILSGARTEEIRDEKLYTMVTVTTPDSRRRLEADAVLIAAGRRPYASELHPEKAGVAVTDEGAVRTDKQLHTTASHIFAIGDVTGGPQFTYISLDDFRIVLSGITGKGNRTVENRGTVPYSVFTDPPFSRAGLTEKEARASGRDVRIGCLKASAIPKARVLDQSTGLLKVIVDVKTDLILGAHLFCAESHEMINLVKTAMDANVPYTALRDAVYTHPTMIESFNELLSSLT